MATIYSISKGQTAQADPRKMTAKRTLTPREQEKVCEEVRAEEILRNPGSRVTVQLKGCATRFEALGRLGQRE